MLTFEKVLEIFADYLTADETIEVYIPFPAQAVVASTIAKALIMLLISFINLFGLFVSMLQR